LLEHYLRCFVWGDYKDIELIRKVEGKIYYMREIKQKEKKASLKFKKRPHYFVYYFYMYCIAQAAWWMTDGPEKSAP